MSAKLILRIAAGLVLFFLAGHTYGHLTWKTAHPEPGAQAMFKAMEDYKFTIGTQLRSEDEFFDGMSLNLSVALVAFLILIWMLSNIANEMPKACTMMLWPVLIAMAGFTYTGFVYFFYAPAITCLIVSILIIAAMLRLRKV
jgi:hypothetical protein